MCLTMRPHLSIGDEEELVRCVGQCRQHGLLSGVLEALEGLVAGLYSTIVRYVLTQGQIPIDLSGMEQRHVARQLII